jgi:hypothetical protein
MSSRKLRSRAASDKSGRRMAQRVAAALDRRAAEIIAEHRHRAGPASGVPRRVRFDMVPLGDALADPVFAPGVAEMMARAALVALHGVRVKHGDVCFVCAGRWSLRTRPCWAVLGFDPPLVGLICGVCMANGEHAAGERLKAVLRDVFGLADVRGLVALPGGRA